MATEVAERLVETGRRMDALTAEIADLEERASAARERAAEILEGLPE